MTFWPAQVRRQRNLPIVFCHVEGQEESSVITTSESNEESKRNMKEVRKAVCENLSSDINSIIITVVCIISNPDLPRLALNRVRAGYEIIVCIACWKKKNGTRRRANSKMGWGNFAYLVFSNSCLHQPIKARVT